MHGKNRTANEVRSLRTISVGRFAIMRKIVNMETEDRYERIEEMDCVFNCINTVGIELYFSVGCARGRRKIGRASCRERVCQYV